MKIKRALLCNIVFALQVFIFSLSASVHFNSFIQQYDTSEVSKQIVLYFKLLKTDTANARKCLEKALTISRKAGYLNGIARSTSCLGLFHISQSDLTKAEEYFIESFEISKKLNNKALRANSANNLGTISEKKGDYSNAVINYLYAFELFDSLNDKNGISATSNNIGIVYYQLDELEKAKDFFELSLNLKQQLNDSLSMIFTFQNLGNVYYDLWEFDSAKLYYEKCVFLSEKADDAVSAGKAFNSLGVIAMIENDHNQALRSFAKALRYSRMKGDMRNLTSVYDNLGYMAFYSGNMKSALSYYDSSLVISKQYGFKEEMKSTYQHMADVYALQGRYKDAYFNLQNYYNLQNDMLAEKSNVAGIEALFVKQKQENKILVLEKEQQKRKTQIVISLAVIIIMLITSVSGFYIYRINQKSVNARKIAELEKERFKAVIEAQEMERKRIAGDLHDSVGQMLSLSKLQLSEIMDSLKAIPPEHEQLFARSSQILDEACQEVRNISHNLMPGPLIRLGLPAAVKELVRKINASKKIYASFSSNLGESRFDEKVEISVYRIIQEILNNIIKHAKASEISIIFNRLNGEKLELSIEDNGIGFDTAEISNSNGIGWKNIYSRLAIINGRMEINSRKNHGTSISVRIFS